MKSLLQVDNEAQRIKSICKFFNLSTVEMCFLRHRSKSLSIKNKELVFNKLPVNRTEFFTLLTCENFTDELFKIGEKY